MKKNIIKHGALVLITILSFSQCSEDKFEVENTNAADTEKVLADATDAKNLLTGAFRDVIANSVDFSAIFPDLAADQITATNAFSGFWDYAKEPRVAINNDPTNQNDRAYSDPWADFNKSLSTANQLLGLIDNGQEFIVGEIDETQLLKSTALMTKGLTLGFLSILYDQAYIVDPTTDLANLSLSNYIEVNATALSTIDEALNIAASLPDDSQVLLHDGYSLSKDEYIKFGNSFAAKFLISLPRTQSEASSVDYAKVLEYANKGITEDFSPPALEDAFFNIHQDWQTFFISEAGYLPNDLKLAHLADTTGTHPDSYPTDNSIVLDSVETNDARFYEYFKYEPAFGFLRESRGRWLFTNYRHIRFFSDNDRNVTGIPVNVFHKAELDYIKVEAMVMSGDLAGARELLNTTPRVTAGNLPSIETDDRQTILDALFYEYAIELDLAGTIGTNWTFMRRHNLLQVGTQLHYPVPADELQILGETFYTFGGAENASNEGTADGSNAWR